MVYVVIEWPPAIKEETRDQGEKKKIWNALCGEQAAIKAKPTLLIPKRKKKNLDHSWASAYSFWWKFKMTTALLFKQIPTSPQFLNWKIKETYRPNSGAKISYITQGIQWLFIVDDRIFTLQPFHEKKFAVFSL